MVISRRGSCLGLFLLMTGQALLAQTVGSVQGTVRDSAGNVVPGAHVTLAGDEKVSTVAGSEGEYALPSVKKGTYALEIEANCFEKAKRPRIVVHPGKRTVANVTLQIAPCARVAASQNAAAGSSDLSAVTFHDDPKLQASDVKDSADAGGYASEAEAARANRLVESVVGLKAEPAADPAVSSTTHLPPAGLDRATLGRIEQELAQAAGAPPENFEANRKLGEFYIHTAKLLAAIPYLKKAYELDPSHYVNAYDLALAYVETQKLDEARRQIQEMLGRRDNAALHHLLGEVEAGAGNDRLAVEEFERAAHLEASEKNIFDWGAELLRHRADLPALEVFQDGMERYPGSAKMQLGLAVALYAHGSYDDAVAALCRATDLEPSDPRPYLFLGKMYDRSPPQAAEVSRRLRRFVELQPQNAQAHYYYALSVWKGKRTENADANPQEIESLLRRALALDANLADAHFHLGVLLAEQKNYADAIGEYQQALRLQPDLSEGHYRLAQAYVRTGERARAEEQFAIYQRLRDQQLAEAEKQRQKVQQFVITLK